MIKNVDLPSCEAPLILVKF